VSAPRYLRRARPALGTLVEIGARSPARRPERAAPALEAAYRVLGEVERALSAFDPASDVGRFNAAPAGALLAVTDHTAAVLRAARRLGRESDGLFDVTLGSGPLAWSLEDKRGVPRLRKLSSAVRLDLGGVGKGYAVDRAFEALARALGGKAGCWVNAGGDLRVTGVELPVRLRDEREGGAYPWLVLREGAIATSHFAPGARADLFGAPSLRSYVSVASPCCLWSDALTKVVALLGPAAHPVLARHRAHAFFHAERGP